jgi:type IV secretory pathway TrbL component
MNDKTVNEIIQWVGTFFILAMYVLMNFFRDLRLDPIAGLLGGLCYALWAYRAANKPQMLINVVAITVCVVGLYSKFN